MRQPTTISVGIASLLVALGAERLEAQRNSTPIPGVRETIALYALADFGSRGLLTPKLGLSPTAEDIVVEAVKGAPAAFHLWRGRVTSSSGWHPYLLCVQGGRLLTLGGFIAPELVELVRLTSTSPIRSLDTALQRARWLALAADPNGATSIVFQDGNEQSSRTILTSWRNKVTSGWPRDTTIVSGEGNYLVQLTVMSQRSWSDYGELWTPIAYTFIFAPDGSLRSWSQHIDESLSFAR